MRSAAIIAFFASLISVGIAFRRTPTSYNRLKVKSTQNNIALKSAGKDSNEFFPFPSDSPPPVIREHPEHANVSTLLVADASNYGIRTALAEEQLAHGNYQEALKLAQEAVQIAGHVREPDNIYTAYAEGIWADALYAMGSYEESAKRYREALKIYERHYRSSTSPEAVELAGAAQLVAWNHLSRGEIPEAIKAWSSALGLTERLTGPNSTDVAACMTNLALSHMSNGDVGSAPEALLKRTLRVYDTLEKKNIRNEGELDKLRSRVRTILGHLYYKRGDDDHAIQCYRSVEELYKIGHVDVSSESALENFGLIMWDRGNKDRAEELLRDSLEIKKNDPAAQKRVGDLLTALKQGVEKPPEKFKRKNMFIMF